MVGANRSNIFRIFAIMKKTLLLAAIALFSCAICSAHTIKATDAKVSYIGRTEVNTEEGTVRFDWSATTLRVRFKGSTLKIKCSDSHKDYFNIWVDKAQCAHQDATLCVEGDTTLTLFKGKKGVHEVVFQKRTEAEQGCLTIQELITDGQFLDAPKGKGRIIEFIGDSYTCGYGTEAPAETSPFLPEEENPSLTYADILARYFDAEAVHISHSGRGVVRNYDDLNKHENMVKLYGQTFDQFAETPWTPTYTPDIVVIYLGGNDFSTGKQPSLSRWCEGYKALIMKVREFHGDVPILCVACKNDETVGAWVKMAVERCGLSGVYAAEINAQAHNNTTDLGASDHPKYKGHRKIASIMAPYIATIMDWQMPFTPYE